MTLIRRMSAEHVSSGRDADVSTVQMACAAITAAIYRLAAVDNLEFWADVQV
jgi:Na+/serine symporter